MNFACVLKSGGDFSPAHVARLATGILKHHPGSHITCLTDCPISIEGVQAVPLAHGWPGWWSKIELFRPGLIDGPTLYLDLDSVVLGPIAWKGEQMTMLRNVYQPGDYGSGAMAWPEAPTSIYERFSESPGVFMRRYRTRNRWGDQGFIRDHLTEKPQTFGAEFRSWKAHCRRGIPSGTKVIYFHGRPRPWQVGF